MRGKPWLAAAELRREPPSDAYAAVIVDEAQDLSCAMVRMLHSLVGDAPDWLNVPPWSTGDAPSWLNERPSP